MFGKEWIQKKGQRLFYMVQENVVAFFCLEHPSDQMYIWFCIKPLFMPPLPYLSLSIGHRLSQIFDEKMNIYDYADIEDVIKYCDIITEFIQNQAIPFIQSIDSAGKIISLLRDPNQLVSAKRLVALSPKTQHEIMMYAELSLHQYAGAKERRKVTWRISIYLNILKQYEKQGNRIINWLPVYAMTKIMQRLIN